MHQRARIRRALIAVVLAFGAVTAPAAGAAQSGPAAVDLSTVATRVHELVQPQADAGLFSGLVLVARGDQVIFERAYGYADWERTVPNGSATRFGIASITKAMTEAVVRTLASEGRLNLDAPVARYLDGFPTGPHGGAPTVRHLLEHRAGVPHRVTDADDETHPLDAAAIVARVESLGLLFEPGSERLYSSAGYTCLARVVEVVEGEPFEEVLRVRVFEPAAMVGATSESGPRLMPRRGLPYRLGADDGRVVVKSAPYKDLRFLTGAGSVYATGTDLLHFVEAIADGVFGEDIRDETFGGAPESWRGWAGRTNGYESFLDVRPDTDLVLVFLSNLQSAANWQLHDQIRNLLDGRPATSVSLPPAVAEPFEDPTSLAGTFGPATVTLEDGALFRGDNEFYPIANERYYIPASGSVMRFRRDAAGRVDAIVSVGGGGRETVLPRSRPGAG